MSVLNIANDGIFNVLIALHGVIAEYGPMEKDRLINLCSTSNERPEPRIRHTLNTWTKLGLFLEADDEIISVDKAHLNRGSLTSACRELLFLSENNENFWQKEKTIAADLTRGLAFILAQDIYGEEFNLSYVQQLEGSQFRDSGKKLLGNDVRWNGLRSWGEYLGFFVTDYRMWPDPTLAIKEELPNIYNDSTTMSAHDFLAKLSDILPVLDSGKYRIEVENNLEKSEWRKPSRKDLLSTSLSRAIWRLSQPGCLLTLEKKADAGSGLSLQRSRQREWATFTHIRFNQD